MTVSSTTRRAGPFHGNDTATEFPFTFKLFATSDLQLTHVDADGEETVLVLDSHYSIELNADQDNDPGGVVTYPLSGDPLATGESLVGIGSLVTQQQTDLTNLGRFLPQTIENALDYLAILIQQLEERLGRAIVVSPSSAEDLADLPAADLAGKFITFDADGNPILTSGTGNDAALRADLAVASTGASLVGFLQAGAGAVNRTARAKMRETVSVTDFGAVGDGVTDDTSAIQAALDTDPGALFFPPGTYIVTSLSIDHSVMIYGAGDASEVKWADGFCEPITGDPEHMFVVNAHGITFSVHDICLNGNFDGQSIADPGGALIMCFKMVGTADSTLTIECQNVTFLNPTDTGIRVDGNIDTEGRELLQVDNCRFLGGAFGLAAGDPLTLASGGYGTDYIRVTDEFRVLVSNTAFVFQKTLPVGKYAPLGLRLTFSDTDGDNLNGATALISGCYFNRVGRHSDAGNPLGAIDCYARARNVTVTGCTFHTCYYTGVRAKTNVDNLTIAGNNFSDCTNSINITGPTYPEQRGLISIVGNNITRGDGDFAISVIGDTNSDPVDCVTIADNNIYDLPNTSGSVYTGNVGSILMRYVDTATISGNTIFDGNVGIHLRDVNNIVVTGNNIRTMRDKGIYVENGTGDFAVSNNVVRSCGSYGIYVSIGADAEVVFSGNLVTSVADYGIRADAVKVAFIGNSVNSVSGSDRAFYASATATFVNMVGNSALGVANPYVDGGSPPTRAFGNSWEPQNDYGTAAPVSGTFAKGDKVWNTNASAAGTVGWICTTAGTPGTWKTFGTIAA